MVQAILINGILLGCIYSLLAVGFALVFSAARILNMALTSFYMVAAYFIVILTNLHLHLLWANLIAALLTIIFSMIFYLLCMDRVKEQETAVMIITVALAMILEELFLNFFGSHPHMVPSFISGFLEIGNVRATFQQLFAIGGSVIMLTVLWVLLTKTKIGGAIRAVSDDKEAAGLVGINVSRICLIVMAISVGIASFAAIIVGPIFMASPYMWLQPLVIVLAAAVLGGLGSIKGSVFGAFILGMVETTVAFGIPEGSYLRGAVSLSVMILVLMFRPEGLFGVCFEEERL